MHRAANDLPGSRLIERLASRPARRAAQRDFLLREMPPGGACIEVGVFEGDFSERILAINAPRSLDLVDPWFDKPDRSIFGTSERPASEGYATVEQISDQYERIGQRFAGEIELGRVRLHRMLSNDAVSRFADEVYDWIYIDASHYYEDVKRDLESYLPKVRRGGYLCGDDYGRRGFWDHGVTRAVDELAKTPAVRRIAVKNHQFILRRS